MREAVVVASSRTPLAKSFRGSLNRTRPDDQAAHCIRDLLRKVPQLAPEGVDAAIGGGVESITATAALKQDRKTWANPWVAEHKPGIYMVMGETAEVVARRYRIGRQVQDEYALASQQRTARAQREG